MGVSSDQKTKGKECVKLREERVQNTDNGEPDTRLGRFKQGWGRERGELKRVLKKLRIHENST